MIRLHSFFLLLFVCLFPVLFTAPAAADGGPVHVIEIDGAISPAYSDYLKASIENAEREGAQALLVELNTPGGLLTSTRDMVAEIIAAPLPIIVYVTPSGAHAASAGTFILMSAHVAAMDEGTNVGAATPVQMSGEVRAETGDEEELAAEEDETAASEEEDMSDEETIRELLEGLRDPNTENMQQKAMEDTAAFIRGIAELRGRNAEWAEKAVTEAKSITAREAKENNVIDLVAPSRTALLDEINGTEVKLKNGETRTLETENVQVVEKEPDFKTMLLAFISDPNVALILMSIGVYGLILEFYNPGTMVAGTIGAICLLLGLYAMNILPVTALGITLILLGAAFMAAEMFIPSFGILGFGGLAAMVTGMIFLYDTDAMPGLSLDYTVIAGIAISGLLVVALIVYLVTQSVTTRVTTGVESMVGMEATLVHWNLEKNVGEVMYQGERWKAYSEDKQPITMEDELVLISAVETMKLKVRKKVT